MTLEQKKYRERGFRYRRVSFALKVISGFWTLAMLIMFFENMQVLTFATAICGSIAMVLPSLLIASVYDDRAEREFNKASAHKAILGVVRPRQGE
jgi:uncharacterized membrane protein (DUF485 family)